MNYKIISFPKDRIYVGMKYYNNEKSDYKDIPTFWNWFTEKLYTSELTDKLIDNNEAIGYRKYCNCSINRQSYQYYAACEIETFKKYFSFDKIIIPKGEYILFKVNYRNKDRDIQEIIDQYLPKITDKYRLSTEFNFEYYTEDFNYQDINTYLYLAIQILEHY